MKFGLLLFVVICLVVSAVGCSPKKFFSVTEPKKSLKPDLEVVVESEQFDGSQLSVGLALKAQKNIATHHAAVRLRLLKAGEITSDILVPLNTLVDKRMLESGDEITVPLVAQGEEITDYQVEVVWGKEAVTLLKAQAKEDLTASVQNVERGEACAESATNCKDRIKALVQITNDGTTTCEGVALRVQLKVADVAASGAQGFVREGKDQKVVLESFEIAPGVSRLVRLNFQSLVEKGSIVIPEVSVSECLQKVVK
jgi:hypothetical protein